MSFQHLRSLIAAIVGLSLPLTATTVGEDQTPIDAQLRIESGHAWRPPFGLDRVGQSLEAIVRLAGKQVPPTTYWLIGYRNENEVSRREISFPENAQTVRVGLEACPAEVALCIKSASAEPLVELTRQTVDWPAVEADAVAKPDRIVNPVDLGTILVPADWLALAGGQRASVDVALVSTDGRLSEAQVRAWYESSPEIKAATSISLSQGRKSTICLSLPTCSTTCERDVLHVGIQSPGGETVWQKQIRVMIVPNPPNWPDFGAVETKLRYDAPISVRTSDGQFTSMDYEKGWDPSLTDIVIALPNGSRFVFWRGSSYIPFWAGKHNTGACYEWAECQPPSDATDAVEPLMDKELRYSRVQIVESTAARIHVRWSYQSCDFNYKTWGDSAVEDYYFYPDGFGTRVLTLQSDPNANYELNELIVLTPQSTYPLSVLPPNLVDILFLDGQKRELTFPFYASDQLEKMKSRDIPAIYRIRFHKDEPAAAVYFSPNETNLPETVYGHFVDAEQIVTPIYWGSHWPLARGNTTGGAIDDRVLLTPAHNSIATWGYFRRPTPLHSTTGEMRDTLDRDKPMLVQTWSWLIGMTDADDARLIQCARSYSNPPSIELQGARLEADSYVPERRAIRLAVETTTVTIGITPVVPWINPVFEISDTPRTLSRIRLASRLLEAKDYAWDGKTLWLHATIADPVSLQLDYSN